MKHTIQKNCRKKSHRPTVIIAGLAALFGSSVSFADTVTAAPVDGTISYVLHDMMWATYQTADAKAECPNGLNYVGPRGMFDERFPKNRERKHLETQLKLEVETWYPDPESGSFPYDEFPFHQAGGALSYGMNLDGETGPNDFTHPDDGTAGIDNQLFRAIGCLIGYRGPDGLQYIFLKKAIQKQRYSRLMIEVTGVDDLVNDPEVQVTFYRGVDRLLTDASGNEIIPGGTQRIDMRWGAPLIRQMDGEIVDGVLTTKPIADMVIPWNSDISVPTKQVIRDARLRLKVTPTGAQGLIAGYADAETWYRSLITSDSTHHLSNGEILAPSVYKALHSLADAYPDPETGKNTAISSAIDVNFTQVYIRHPEGELLTAQ